jgi:hypothetical protein
MRESNAAIRKIYSFHDLFSQKLQCVTLRCIIAGRPERMARHFITKWRVRREFGAGEGLTYRQLPQQFQ